MKKLLRIGLVGLGLVLIISLALIPSGWHRFSFPFVIPFSVMVLISLTNKNK